MKSRIVANLGALVGAFVGLALTSFLVYWVFGNLFEGPSRHILMAGITLIACLGPIIICARIGAALAGRTR